MSSLRFSMMAAVLLACAASGFAQESSPCALTKAPAVAGFRLGMSTAEVKKSLEDASMFDNKISSKSTTGAQAVNVSAAELSAKAGDGIESVYLSFVDDKLAHIKVTFNGASWWDGLQDFFARESAKLGLPKPAGPSAFEGSGGNEKYVVRCEAFNAVLAYAFGVSPSIAVSDLAARTLVDKRRERDETTVQQTKIRSVRRPGQPPNPLPPQTGEPGPRPDPGSRGPN